MDLILQTQLDDFVQSLPRGLTEEEAILRITDYLMLELKVGIRETMREVRNIYKEYRRI